MAENKQSELPEEVARIKREDTLINEYQEEAIQAAGYELVKTLPPPPGSTILKGKMTMWGIPGQDYMLLFMKIGDSYQYAAMVRKTNKE